MFDEKAGIMEDHRRELAYFEKDDLNLPPELEIKDGDDQMQGCQHQDGIVSISSNLERYYPEVSTKTTKLYMKPNSFNPEKLMRAEVAEKLYKVDQILAPTARVDAHENIVMDNRSSQDGGRIRK